MIDKLKTLRPLKKLSRSLFGKYFAACAAVILLCFLFMGSAVTFISVKYSNSQKADLYKQSVDILSQMILRDSESIHRMYGYNDDASRALAIDLQQYAEAYSRIINANIYIVDTDGNILAATQYNSSPGDIIGAKIPSDVMKPIINNKKDYYGTDTLGGFYSRQFVTVGAPVKDDSGGVLGGVFISSPANSLINYIPYLIRTFIICIAIALVFAFAAIYFLTRRLVSPLRQMSSAATSFAKGDFSTRVPVQDNDEVGQLAVAFNNMASSLTTLEDMRRSFVANVSHELKTPMTSIAGFIDGILDGTVPEEKREYYLNIVSDEVKRLSRLVHQFLDIARIEAGELKINPTQFDVEETVRRVIVGFEYAINEKKLVVRGLDESADVQMMVYADPDLTHQTLYNLVDNAVKFADNGGYIEINVVRRGKQVYISVKNSGMGIPQQELPFVFNRFFKTDKSRSFDRKGVGLGLYIAKTVLNIQKEDIVVKSVEGEFCEFVFTLRSA